MNLKLSKEKYVGEFYRDQLQRISKVLYYNIKNKNERNKMNLNHGFIKGEIFHLISFSKIQHK